MPLSNDFYFFIFFNSVILQLHTQDNSPSPQKKTEQNKKLVNNIF